MGSSGTGKTTLLNILAMREQSRKGVNVTGDIIINDELPLTREIFGKIGAYVTQDDVLYRFFSPREALTFAARLKLPGNKQAQDHRVKELLEELGLTKVADIPIGSAL